MDPISPAWLVPRPDPLQGRGNDDVLGRGVKTGQLYIRMMNGPTVVGGTGFRASQADNT